MLPAVTSMHMTKSREDNWFSIIKWNNNKTLMKMFWMSMEPERNRDLKMSSSILIWVSFDCRPCDSLLCHLPRKHKKRDRSVEIMSPFAVTLAVA